MRLRSEFIRLPLAFDAARLRAEVEALGEAAWRPHPQGHPGNSALPLIARDGDPTDDAVDGAMLPTAHLQRLEYFQQVLASFGSVLGRSRLMRIDGGASATRHVDTNLYWAERVRVHVPVVTDPRIRFLCGEHDVHMRAGEAWVFDAWLPHDVLNPTDERRIHLVADVTGSPAFWDLVRSGTQVGSRPTEGARPRRVPHQPGVAVELRTERHSSSPVMTPWEQELRRTEVLDELVAGADAEPVRELEAALRDLGSAWREAWSLHGGHPGGRPMHEQLLAAAERRVAPLEGRLALRNGSDAVAIVRQRLLRPGVERSTGPAPAPGTTPAGPTFRRPLFIVGAPRSRTSLIFEAVARCPDAWTIGGEAHEVLEGIEGLAPADRGWDSNRLEALDATPARVAALTRGLHDRLRDHAGAPPPPGATGLRLVEKTPRNALRVPFLAAAFPDALFLHVHRDAEPTIASMIEAWRSGRFVTYPRLPAWPGPPWSLLLPPGWRELAGRDLPAVASEQWRATVAMLLDDLDGLDPARTLSVDADAFAADPEGELARICAFAELTPPAALPRPLPLSRHTLTPPSADKWREHEAELAPLRDRLSAVASRSRRRVTHPDATPAPTAARAGGPLGSVATGSFAEALDQTGGSLLVSTYQAGRLVVLRQSGGRLNAHFRQLPRPMGIAFDRGRLAVGTSEGIVEYRDAPQVAGRLDASLGTHDACFLPRRSHVTGDAKVHDVAYVGGELWFVATAFSCLATLDEEHSLVPRWAPPWVTALTAEDRCHLNGLAVVDGRVRFVTALGTGDGPRSWKEGRADGGVLYDLAAGDVLSAGLSMPHSPRWHDGRLWVLESGRGSLATVDLATGELTTVTQLPGFTRGLAFAGHLAFVGLSQAREATTFGGVPLTARADTRRCGVWCVDLRTGETVAVVEFQDAVQELFEVAYVPHRFPEVAEQGSDVTRGSFVLPPVATHG